MICNWPVYKVGDLEKEKILLVQDGNHGEYRPRKNEFEKTGVAFIRAADLGHGSVQFDSAEKINDVAFARITKGIGKDLDTILSTKGTVGKIAFVPLGSPEYVCSPQTSFWRSLNHKIIDPVYLYYEIQSRHFKNQILSRKGETDMADYLSLTTQRGLTIRVPPIQEQREIVKVLFSIDRKIELNRQMNQTLEAMAQAIFKSWFVDFDPVVAKAEGRKPVGISDKIAALFPGSFEESELGSIPKGWKVIPFSGIATLKTDSINPGKESELCYEHFSIPAFDQEKLPVYELGEQIKSNKYKVYENSILSSKLNPHTPRTWLPSITNNVKSVCSTEFMNFVPKSQISKFYIYSLICSKYFQDGIMARVTGTTGSRQRARPKEVANMPIIFPGEKIVNAYDEIAAKLLKKATHNLAEGKSLSLVRDTLLPKLLSGELPVGQAEKVLKEAV